MDQHHTSPQSSSLVSCPTGRSLGARLTREWRVLAVRPAVVQRARAWALPVEVHTLDDLLAATGFVAGSAGRVPAARSPERGNDMIARLLVLARTDDLAARVLLQRLLPGLVTVSRRWPETRPGGSIVAFDELVTSAWQVVRTFPLDGERHHLAARILRRVEHVTFIKPRRRLGRFDAVEPQQLDLPVLHPGDPEPVHELAEAVAIARPFLTEHDLVVLRLLAGGRTLVEVADELSVSVRTVANHRDAMVHRVRAAVRAA